MLVPTLSLVRSASEKIVDRTSRMVASSSSMDSPMRSSAGAIRDRARGGLQRHAHGEEPLDDVVVQVPGDALAVAHDGELFAVVLGTVELDGQARLLSEALDDPDLLGAETGARPASRTTPSTPSLPCDVVIGTRSSGPSPAGTASGWSTSSTDDGIGRHRWSDPR